MAKISLQEKLKNMDKLAEGYNKKAGKVMMGRISESEELREALEVEWIKTPSLNVNEIMGGGIPKSKVTIVAGMPDSGKTFYLLETIGKAMADDPNFVAGWLESEGSITSDNLRQFNIDVNRFFYQRFDKAGGAEKALDGVEAALLTGLDMFVINSLKCLVPSEELAKEMEKQQVGLQARMNSKMMRKLKTIVVENNIAFVMVQHLSTQIGQMYGDPMTISGGYAIRYGADIIMDFRKKSIGEADPIDREEGVKIGVAITKNHVVTDRYPYLRTDYYGIFGQGTEIYLEAIDLAIGQGLLVKAGAFIKVPDEQGNPKVLPDGTKLQWQGTAKFRQYCIDNPDFFNDLVGQLQGDVEQMSEEEVATAKEDEQIAENTLVEVEGEDVLEESRKRKKKK